ncbi:MAG: hypothetical protein RDV48_02140 [Candidatus Eremiobacteraeota bacterium]|nr:hypothetical protein [Candidatus Eremiobacteraeota bacterium]
MIDKIGEIGGGKPQEVRQTVEKSAGDLIKNQVGEAQDKGGISTIDAGEVSDEAMEQLEGQGGEGADIESILKNILEAKQQGQGEDEGAEEAGEEGAQAEGGPQQANQAQGAQGAGDGKKEVEEVKVSWSPLMKEGQVLDTGDAIGHFNISREKKQVDDKQAGGGAQAPQQGSAPQAAQPAAGKGAVGKGAKVGAMRVAEAPKGQDGKTPQMMKGANGPEDQGKEQPKGSGVENKGDGKLYVKDEGTGEMIEIPENGDIKATHPMKIMQLGKIGELNPGDLLFTYEFPKGDEVEKSKKAKEQGLDPVEGVKQMEQQEKAGGAGEEKDRMKEKQP